jgi:citrate synthase
MEYKRKSSFIDNTSSLNKFERILLDLTPTIPNSEEKCKIIFPDGKEIELPILKGTEGPPMIDIRQLHEKSGYFTYDPGFSCSGSCASQITFIDGEKGILRYRGYNIDKLAPACGFEEICYLLLYGELPSKKDFENFVEAMKDEMLIHEQLISFFKGFQKGAHPMAILVGVVGALSAFMHDGLDLKNKVERELCAIKLVSKFPMISALAYRTAMGLPIVYPKRQFTFSQNFLYMMYCDITDNKYNVDPFLADVLDKILVLHADHEQNASTATVRIAGSSIANPYACIAAGIASLWGPNHGGANEAVLDMLEKIGTKDNIPKFIEDVKNKKEGVRLMGFGHRVYKNYDPRAENIRDLCHKVLDYLEIKNDPFFSIAIELEKIALSDEYFIKRKLYPNVDFYSGIVLNAMGIPKSMFTVIFALSRSIGWIAQWREMSSESNIRIGRPRQLYVGYGEREFKSLEKRKDTFEYKSDLKVRQGRKRFGTSMP